MAAGFDNSSSHLAALPNQASFAQVYGFAALAQAFDRARRAKKGRGGEPLFFRELEHELLRLEGELRDRRWTPGPYRFFWLRKTKARLVSEAAFRDRVVHHALVAELERVWEPKFIEHSFACRRDKGSHAALRLAQQLCRRYPYALRLDVEKYFDSIRHEVLCSILAPANDGGTQWLCERIVEASRVPTVPAGSARGIPIGNLTSQFFANLYLHPLDELARTEWPTCPWLRYMDDVLVFSADKEQLWAIAAASQTFLRNALGLELKASVTAVMPVEEGIVWLGMRVFPRLVRLQRDGRTRFAAKIRRSVTVASNETEMEHERGRAASLCGHLQHGSTLALRRSILSSIFSVVG